MERIILQEVVPRGFLSNYTTILTSFRYLVSRNNINPDNIKISSGMFSLYGNPVNWFDSDKISNTVELGNKLHPSTDGYDFDPWPTEKQLDLLGYIQYFPYNERIENYLKYNIKNINNCLGIHFRGTDHCQHVDEVPLNMYLNSSMSEFLSHDYDSIFICSDEENIIEQFRKFFNDKLNFKNIIFNDVNRSRTKIALHHSGFDFSTRIKLGDEVLLDSHSLSKCSTIIGKTSNLVTYARILNPKIKILYQDMDLQFRK